MIRRLSIALFVAPLACTPHGTGGGSGGRGGTTPGGNSVLERNNHPTRDGHFVQPALTRTAAATMASDSGFAATFTGAMHASPLYLENGPGGKGVFFAVTTSNDVIALDETTGATVWTHNIGASPTMNGVSCGYTHPLGIISTPVIDAAARTIFVAGAIGATSIESHEVHALSVDDGTERPGWPVDVSTMTANGVTFSPPPQNQRAALALVGGTVYVAYGGHPGDCGDYRGWVIGINAADPSQRGAWVTGGTQEGIWAGGGLASDGNGVFAMTGNGSASSHTDSDSEEVVRIVGLGTLDRNDRNIFYPTRWQAMDSGDLDLGSANALVIDVAGATPSKIVVAISKDGHMYLLDAANLGGMGGQKVDFSVAASGMSIHATPTAYRTPMGVHVAFAIDSGAQCPAGGPAGGKAVMSVLIPAGAPPAPRVLWCAPMTGSEVTAPIATTTDGTNDAIVWYVNNNKLTGVDGETGATIFTGTDTCTGVHRFSSPIAVKGRIVTSADNHLCSWSPH